MKTTTTILLLIAVHTVLRADPCGMVPPVQLTSGAPELMRVGDQLTYVFFKDGVQDIALRPGFKGKLTDFGMLIPFPAVPDIRKVSDNIFTHLKHAIDPPEIVIDMRPVPELPKLSSAIRDEMDVDELYLGGSRCSRRRRWECTRWRCSPRRTRRRSKPG